MTDLSDVTTDEMFRELRKRNDGVIVAAFQFLGADKRCALYTNWHGPKVVLAGLWRQVDRELEAAWQVDDATEASVEEEDGDER